MPLLGLALLTAAGCGLAPGDIARNIIMPEQRTIVYRDPSQFPPARLPDTPPPRTVTDPRPEEAEWRLSLDDAVRIAVENARIIRTLAGLSVANSGRTIYDAAIVNTTIDQAQAVFDPVLKSNNLWSRTNVPQAQFATGGAAVGAAAVPTAIGTGTTGTGATGTTGTTTGTVRPGTATGTTGTTTALGGTGAAGTAASPALRTDPPAPALPPTIFTSTPVDNYRGEVALTKTNVLGGQWSVDYTATPTRIPEPGPFPLNPQTPTSLTLNYTQPLLQGAGFRFNTAPIVIARLNTEQSFFQYKDSVQDLVRGVIEGYWNLVEARVNVWARKIQVQQSKEAYERERARLQTGFSDIGTVSQARVTLEQFEANLIAAQADVLAREGALRDLLFLPPDDGRRIVPTSAPVTQRLPHDWQGLVQLADQRRPDIIELKIITEADQVRLLQAENQALPQLNAIAQYRWNGLSGEMPNEQEISTRPGQFTDWQAGINFSVPLGLRQGRALVREQRLIIARDRANVDQQLHNAVHELAASLRDLDSAYEQYLAFKETRAAAEINLKVQNEKFRTGQTIYLNVLQALNDWGNAVSSEAQQLLNYNITLAALERQTGTILETHGLVFAEERFRAAGPLLVCDRLYPKATVPRGGPHRYPGSGEPAEDSFNLQNPDPRPARATMGAPEPIAPGPKPYELPPPRPTFGAPEELPPPRKP
jgi:outer membrane protein TolC